VSFVVRFRLPAVTGTRHIVSFSSAGGAAANNTLWALETKLAEYGIEIPFPQRDLHLRSGFRGNSETATEIELPGQ
jgi:small-conductance mechanosensitive channel